MALTNKLSAIGNAIRSKTGGTELLTLDQMPTAIASIETGGSWNTYTGKIVLQDTFTNNLTIPVDTSQATFIIACIEAVKTGTITDGEIVYDEGYITPPVSNYGTIMGYWIISRNLLITPTITYRYSPTVADETYNYSNAYYRYATRGTRGGWISITINDADIKKQSGILLSTQNGGRSFCQRGAYIEFNYTVKMM